MTDYISKDRYDLNVGVVVDDPDYPDSDSYGVIEDLFPDRKGFFRRAVPTAVVRMASGEVLRFPVETLTVAYEQEPGREARADYNAEDRWV